MAAQLHVQRISGGEDGPSDAEFQAWADAALAGVEGPFELVLRIVGEDEAERLNRRYRDRTGPTNVLSFPAAIDADLARRLRSDRIPVPLGDLVICAPLVRREAEEQGKALRAHWAHLVVHGALHLLGFDHQESEEAAAMEAREREVLGALGFDDPYAPR